MTHFSPLQIGFVALTFALAGMVKGVTGMGLPTVAMGLLGSLLSPAAAAALIVVPSFVTNIWQLFAGRGLAPLARRLATMMIGIVIGIFLGVQVLTSNSGWATGALGTALTVYAALGLASLRPTVSRRMEPLLSPPLGLATGLVAGATGVTVMPAVPYLQSLDLDRDDLIQALGLTFTVSTIALAGGLSLGGALHAETLGLSVGAILPALGGMWLGQRLRARLDPPTFRRWFLIALLVLGGQLIVRAFL